MRRLRQRVRHAGARLTLAVAALAGTAGAGGPSPGVPPAGVSVLTFNLYHDRADWPDRLPLIVAGLRELRPDVIALQEVLQDVGLPNQAHTIADALGYEVHFVSTDATDAPRRYGNAILTRHPILQRSERRLRPLADGRTVAHVRLRIDGRTIDVHATHLHHELDGAGIREQQLRDVLAHVDAHADGSATLLLGDFNAPATARELTAVRARFDAAYGSHKHETGDPAALTTLNPAYFGTRRRIDHVFFERGRFKVREARVVLDVADASGTWPSDHFGMHAVLEAPSALPAHGSPGERPGAPRSPAAPLLR